MQQLLLLPSARSAVLIPKKRRFFDRFLETLFVLGLLVARLGGLDLARRVPGELLSADALTTAFAPAILIAR